MGKISQKTCKKTTHKSNNVDDDNNTKAKRKRKIVPRDSPPQRSSIYRGITRHRWTGRYEAHLWDKNCWNESQNKKGRQVYLGAYDDEETAAHAYDLAALKYWGHETILNFRVSTYEEEIKDMENQSREEYIGSLRRKSSGFSRGVSKYRGVARMNLDDDTLPPDDDLDVDAYEPLAINDNENNLATASSSEPQPRKPRGPNKRKWAIDGNPQPMEFDVDGSAVGAKFKDLNSYIAEVGRDLKLDVDDFRLMPDEELTWAWQRIKDRIAWTDEQDIVLQTKVMNKSFHKASVAWKQKKGNLRKDYYNANKNDPSRWIPPDVNIDQEQWKHLVLHWDDPHYKEKQTVNQQNRSQQEFQHCTGSKPHAVIANEYLCKHGKLPDMVTLYLLCHTKGQDEKSWIDEGSKQKWGQIQTSLSEMPLEIQNTTEGRKAAWEKVFHDSTIGYGVSAVDKPDRKRGKSAIDMAIAKIYVELQAQFEAKLNANQKLVEERIEEERRKFEMARKDWEAEQVIQQQKWMDEGVRRWEAELRQFRPPELDTPAWLYDDSEYMNESYNPLAQARRLNDGGRRYAPQREFRYNSFNTSHHISQPTLGDNHGWRQPRAHLPGNMSSIGFASTPSPQPSVAPVDADFTSSISPSHNEFFDAQTSYRPCMDLVNRARRGQLSSTQDATSNHK